MAGISLRVVTTNSPGGAGYTYDYQAQLDGHSVLSVRCGEVQVSPCGGDTRAGVVFDQTVAVS